MDFKEFLLDKLMLFFTLTTCITVAIFLLGSFFDGDSTFGYEAFLSPMIFAGACVLPSCVTYSKRELTVKQLILRKVIEVVFLEGVVLGIAYGSSAIDTSRISIVVSLGVSVMIIFIVVNLLDWLRNYVEAKKLTKDIVKYQEKSVMNESADSSY